MSRRTKIGLAVLGVGVFMGGVAIATPGLNGGIISVVPQKRATFVEDIDVSIHLQGTAHEPGYKLKLDTKGVTDIVQYSSKMLPGGSSGWHTHSGPAIVSVRSGALTLYDGDDPNCEGHVVTAGHGFVDAGQGHIHLARNEGTVDATWDTILLMPEGGVSVRGDAPQPAQCTVG